MAGQEFQYIGDILKEFYAPAIVNQVYKKAPMWAQVQKRDRGMYGKRVTIPVQTAFTEAVGSRVANNYSLPTAQRNTYDQAYVYMKRIYGRIKVDGFSIESAKGKGGWVDIVTAETKGVSNAFAIEVDRQSMGRGTGIVGTYVSGGGSTSMYVDAPNGIASDTPLAKWFRVGMVIDSHDITNAYTKLDNGLTITAVNATTGLLTVDSACSGTLADGDYVCREDVFSSTADNIGDMMGIDGIVDSSDVPGSYFQGIARSSEETWQAYESSTSQVLSEDVIQNALDAIEVRTDGSSVDLAITTYALRNKLIDIIRSDRQITTLDLKAGWKAISYVGGSVSLPIMVHKNCPAGYMYFISLPHIYFYTLKNLVWDDKGGGVVKPVASEDAYEAWFKMYGNIATDCCNAHGKLTGLTTS